MAEILVNGSLYKVTMTEYERGYGQRPMGTRFFDSEQDAKAFVTEYNRDPGSPDCFFRAEYTKVN
jgi:hypothetical protein